MDRTSKGTYTTIKGTKKLHHICSCGTNGVINVRELSCYCFNCLQNNYTECQNQGIVNAMSSESFSPDAEVPIKKGPRQMRSTQGTALLNEEEHKKTDAILMHELVTENSIVAVRPKKVGLYDFFVLELTSEKVETLVKDKVDEFGTSFPKGSKSSEETISTSRER